MSYTTVPQGTLAPLALVFPVVPAGYAPPAPGPLTLGVEAFTFLDLSTVTGASVLVRKPDGTRLTWEASYSAATSQELSGATNASPIVVTVPNVDLVGTRVDIAGVGGNTAANGGPFYVLALGPTTFALYEDPELTVPIAGNGAYTSGGEVVSCDAGTVTYDLAGATPSAPVGDLDILGVYVLAVQLTTSSETVPCRAVRLNVISPFA